LGNEISEFKITVEAMWSNDGSYEEFVPLMKDSIVEEKTLSNRSKKAKKENKKNIVIDDIDDLITDDEDSDS